MGSEMRGALQIRPKAISAARDRAQSEMLIGAVGALLVAKAVLVVWGLHRAGALPAWLWVAFGVSAAFAALVWGMRSATGAAAAMGGVICLNILLGQGFGMRWQQTAMPGLIALFVLTFVATRFGRGRKEGMGVAEAKRGRRASQVIANLGIAGLCGGAAGPVLFAACVAALAEATADTVSSEMGQALGGRTLLLTSWREVPVGTDGGISIAGTVLGAVGAGAIVLVTAGTGVLSVEAGMVVLGAAVAGLIFDSWLGATVERRGWLGNDVVNFSSTVFAAIVAGVGVHLWAR